MLRSIIPFSVFTALISSLGSSTLATEPASVFAALGSHPYIPANSTYAAAPAAYVITRPGWPTAPWSLPVPSAYNTPHYTAVSPVTIPGWRYADSPKYFRPGFGYVLPSEVFRSFSSSYLERPYFSANNPMSLIDSSQYWTGNTPAGPQYSAGTSVEDSPLRFNW